VRNIGRIRQEAALAVAGFLQGCGTLRHSPPSGAYRHVRYAPPADLADWVEHFWCESWQFQETQIREVVPHPCVHLVLTSTGSRIVGVQSRRFARELSGERQIFGVRFRAGAFFPFCRRSLDSFANSLIPADGFFPDVGALEQDVLAMTDEHDRVAAVSHYLRVRVPQPDAKSVLAVRAVSEIRSDRSMNRVQALAEKLGAGERSLQRLFQRYVGVSARWVIHRYRLFEALEQLAHDSDISLADLALELGYFDQAHFTNDFTRMVGHAPARYSRS
jgi:AraC-like DNA-binding protein